VRRYVARECGSATTSELSKLPERDLSISPKRAGGDGTFAADVPNIATCRCRNKGSVDKKSEVRVRIPPHPDVARPSSLG
jgi:hypothetical protein